MSNIAILGHATRGREVIELLEMLGGENPDEYKGYSINRYYYIDDELRIDWCHECTPDSDFVSYTLEEFLEKFPYKVGDKVYNIIHNENQIITNLVWHENEVVYQTNNNEYGYINYLQPFKEETMEKQNKKSVNHVYESEVISFGIALKDKYELDLQGKFDVKLRDGKYFVEKIKPKYPKTYVECAKILNCFGAAHIDGYKCELLEKFQELLICRDAYWKIAGEQMGLGKPWEPDWNDDSQFKYIITCRRDKISEDTYTAKNCNLAFPTAEMRGAFKENFDKDIDLCKELL